jgi:hypothetical protein
MAIIREITPRSRGVEADAKALLGSDESGA